MIMNNKRLYEGGQFLLDTLDKAKKNGGEYPSEKEMWDMLGDEGYSEDERIKIAETVNAFLRHKNGDHSRCHNTCGASDNIAPPKITKKNKPKYSASDLEDMR